MSDASSTLKNIDPIVRELLPGYLKRRDEEFIRLKALLASQDFEAIRTLGHNLSGSGGAYGLQTLTEIGRRIEMAAKNSDSTTLSRELEVLGQFLLSVKAEVA